jgi:dynein intermediate chain 1, axonemal
MQDGEINFYSVSADGKIFNWVLMQNKLSLTTIMTLFLENGPVLGPDGTNIRLKGSGTCMVFHPTNREVFQVGTEEGLIFKCSTAYSSKYFVIELKVPFNFIINYNLQVLDGLPGPLFASSSHGL